MKESSLKKIEVLPNFQGLFFDQELKSFLYKKYKIISKNVGIDKSTKTMKDFLIQPFLIDEFSLVFLAEKQQNLLSQSLRDEKFKQKFDVIQKSIDFQAFKLLKQQYFLINGHKFGCSFLAYDKNPQKNHAKALIFCGLQSQMTQKFNHMTRLSQIAKKQCHFIFRNEESLELQIKILQRQINENTKKEHKKSKLSLKIEQKS